MPTMLLVAFGVAALVILIVSVVSTTRRMRDQRDAGPEAPRTEEQKAHDRQTAVNWGIALVLLIVVLCGAYLVTR